MRRQRRICKQMTARGRGTARMIFALNGCIVARINMNKEEPAMEGSHEDKASTTRYFERFRQLSRNLVEYLLRHHPLSAQDDWQCQCYESLPAFLTQFPSAHCQREIIRRLERTRRHLRCQSPALDLLVEWTEDEASGDEECPI